MKQIFEKEECFGPLYSVLQVLDESATLSPFRRPYQQTFPCSSASSPLYYYRAWRLKLVLLYCFAASVATAGGLVLRTATTLALNWNQQFYLDPVPFHLSLYR